MAGVPRGAAARGDPRLLPPGPPLRRGPGERRIEAPAGSPARKILIRVIGAPILLAALAGLLYLDHYNKTIVGLRCLVAAVCALGAWEFYRLCRRRGHETAWIAGLLAVALPALPWLQFQKWLGLLRNETLTDLVDIVSTYAWMLFILYVLCKLVFRWGRFTVEAAALTAIGYLYLGLLRFAFSTPQPLLGMDVTWWVLFMVATNKGSDMAAFCAGKLFGRHKMTPELSPNKTWEGAFAGAIVGTAAGWCVIRTTPIWAKYAHVPAGYLLFFALLVTIASQVGDLVESAFKRWAGAKDSGTLAPEFGGILDMADSFILSLPIAYLLSEYLYRTFR